MHECCLTSWDQYEQGRFATEHWKMCCDENSKRESHLRTVALANNEIIKSLDDKTNYKSLGLLYFEKVFCYKMKESLKDEYCLRAVVLKSKRTCRNAVPKNIPE